MENNLLDDLTYLDKEKPRFIYVGLGKRFVATLIDFLAWFLILIVVFAVLGLIDVFLSYGLSARIEEFVVGLISLLYYPLLESSALQGSAGKHLMSSKVVDKEGNRLTLGLASARLALKFLSYALLFSGFIMIAFTKNKQGLHDIILGTYVVEK